MLTTDGRLSDARPASDVNAWAKAATKPVYTWGEITGKPTTFAPTLQPYADWNALAADNYNGFAWGSTNSPIGGGTTIGFSVPFISSVGDEFSFQMASRLNRVYFRNRESGTLNAWNELFHTGHLPDWTEISGKPTTFAPSAHTHNMNEIADAGSQVVEAGTITRKVFLAKTKSGNGYISRVALGLTNPLSQFSPAILSVGTNDAGTSWVDFTFNRSGRITSPAGTFALTSEIPTELPADGGNADTVDGVHFMNTSDANIPAGLFGYRASNKQVYYYDADKVAGFLSENGYMLRKYLIDASALDPNTYYPVTIQVATDRMTRIEIHAPLGLSKPGWATHAQGFSCSFAEETYGSGWGATNYVRNVFENNYRWADRNPIGGWGQMTNSSNEYIYVCGGAKYYFYVSGNCTPVLRTASYTVSSQTVTPTTTPPFNTGDRVMNNIGGDIVGDFRLANGKYLRAPDGVAIFGTNAANTQQVVGNTTAEMVIRSGNQNLLHQKNAAFSYIIWDASNANLLSVDWKAKELRTAGTVIMYATA